jgi:excisionase family DNA binding protein
MRRDEDSPVQPGLMRIDSVCKYLDIGRSKVYQLIRGGQLKTIKVSRRISRVTIASLNEFVERMPESSRGSPIIRRVDQSEALADYIVRNSPSQGDIEMVSFQDILSRKASDIKPPPAYPVGTYHCLVDGPPAAEESSQKGTPCRVYRFKILAPGSDVNPQDLAEIEGGVIGKIITGQPHAAFYIVETAVWRYKEFLEGALGISVSKGNGEEKTLLEMEAEAPGKQVMVKLKQEISQDGKRMVHRIDSYARV